MRHDTVEGSGLYAGASVSSVEYSLLPAEESAARISRLQEAVREEGLDGFLLTQNTDIYYLTGTMQTGYCFIPAEGEAVLYVRRSAERAREEAHIRTEELGAFREFGAKLAAGLATAVPPDRKRLIGTPLDVLPAQTYLKLADLLEPAGAVLADASPVMRQLRMIKSSWEIARITQAAQAAAEALAEALNDLKEGVSELDWMARYEYEIRKRGHIGLMRMRAYNQEVITGMVGAGEAAAVPSYFDGPAGGKGLGSAAPQSVSRRLFRRNEPILLDVGCCIDGYIIDQTRTAVMGELPEELLRAYGVTERIMRQTEKLLQPGIIAEKPYQEALHMAEQEGLADHFMGCGADRVRFLGHGIGLEVDEWPVLAKGFTMPLRAGMVIAVEPKFTFPGAGVVGIENTYVIQEEGPPLALTQSPEQLIVLP
ncbi:aminopeptidase P family protein [Paenibacillus sambharensis]|uniref:Aminopeptidase P family protein n=1 Tax=Paenibacillus sambharensis TaxID=1803190 RepID=A0A2W1LW03_9BACL|nr:Xaa-Pro peptidase family protein [Paenibacillus sambharensis]PZD95687.1 aminopeptidase P family protein [Paenibacillus sambharensis]